MPLEHVFGELLARRKARGIDKPFRDEKATSTYLFLEEHLEAPGSNRGNPDEHKNVKNRGEKLGVYFVSTFGQHEGKGFRFLVLNKSEWLKWRLLQEMGFISNVRFFHVDPETLRNYTEKHRSQGDISKYYLNFHTIF